MPNDSWIQWGCFGLITLLIGWALRFGIPGLLDLHEKTISRLVLAFEGEVRQCREERIKDRETHVSIASMLGGKLDLVTIAVQENTSAVERVGLDAREDAKHH